MADPVRVRRVEDPARAGPDAVVADLDTREDRDEVERPDPVGCDVRLDLDVEDVPPLREVPVVGEVEVADDRADLRLVEAVDLDAVRRTPRSQTRGRRTADLRAGPRANASHQEPRVHPSCSPPCIGRGTARRPAHGARESFPRQLPGLTAAGRSDRGFGRRSNRPSGATVSHGSNDSHLYPEGSRGNKTIRVRGEGSPACRTASRETPETRRSAFSGDPGCAGRPAGLRGGACGRPGSCGGRGARPWQRGRASRPPPPSRAAPAGRDGAGACPWRGSWSGPPRPRPARRRRAGGNSKPCRPFSLRKRIAENGRPKREVKSVEELRAAARQVGRVPPRALISRLQTVRGST